MMKTIDIENCGPVEKITIPIPEEGGIIVLRGRNGVGKSHTLDAIQSAVSGRGTMPVRDAATKGKVEGLGVTMTVGRSTRRTGELEVTSLEGRLSVADLVDPGLKSADAADAKRVKALVALTGQGPDPALFYGLLGGQQYLEQFCRPDSLSADDPVTMADRIKRDLDAAARIEENQAEHDEIHYKTSLQQLDGIDLTAECDDAKIQVELELAIEERQRLISARDAVEAAVVKQAQAQAELTKIEVGYTGPGLVECEQRVAECAQKEKESQDALKICETAFVAAQQDFKEQRIRHQQAQHDKQTAQRHQEMLEKLRKIITCTIPAAPTEDEIQSVEKSIKQLKKDLQNVAVVQRAQDTKEKASEILAKAEKHKRRAEALRNAAGSVYEVLDSLVGKTTQALRVEAGRLVLDTHRGKTFYSDLSDGERWKIALDIAIDAVGDHGLVVLPQYAYEGLDPLARQLIAEHARSRKAVIVTAESSADEEMTTEVV